MPPLHASPPQGGSLARFPASNARLATHLATAGPEYVMPVRDIGRHGYKSDIKALCWMYCLMSCIFGCGVGQFASLCGAAGHLLLPNTPEAGGL